MTVSSVTQTGTTTQTSSSSASAASTSSGTAISADFQTFLTMLTAQLQNQDPLNPMDSADYAVQLATFSGVEQQVQTNTLLQKLVGSGSGNDLISLANWVGLEAKVDGAAYYGGSPMDYAVEVPSTAQWSQLVIRNAAGKEVSAIDLTTGTQSVTWDGTTSAGAAASKGYYTAELHVYTGGESAPTVTEVPNYMRIVEVRQGTDGAEAVLANGAALPIDQVTALRSPT